MILDALADQAFDLADAEVPTASQALGASLLDARLALVTAYAAEALMIAAPELSCMAVMALLGVGRAADLARAMSGPRFDPDLPPRIAARLAASSAHPRAA